MPRVRLPSRSADRVARLEEPAPQAPYAVTDSEPLPSFDPASTLVARLPLLRRIATLLSRRHGLDAADCEEFTSWATARLIEGDYAILRKFGGRSSLDTYLTVVVRNLFRDYRKAEWGRWRPSAEASRGGPWAVRLEELVTRDGMTVSQAVRIVGDRDGAPSSDVLRSIATKLPRRLPTREVALDAVIGFESLVTAPSHADTAGGTETSVVTAALEAVVTTLPPEDAILVRMRFWSALSVAAIARALQLDQKALYRRLDSLQARLRGELEARGIDRAAVLDAFGGDLSW